MYRRKDALKLHDASVLGIRCNYEASETIKNLCFLFARISYFRSFVPTICIQAIEIQVYERQEISVCVPQIFS